MYWVNLASRILHILGAVILVGGLFYLRVVVTPGLATSSGGTAEQYFGSRRAAWAKWVGIATLLLIATGLWNYMQIIKTHERMASSYHMLAGLKMLAGIALFALAALVAGRTATAETLRQRMRYWLSVCLLLGIATIAIGSVLRSYPHTRRIDATGPPVLIAPDGGTVE
jgi:uncharacterized membrane protein